MRNYILSKRRIRQFMCAVLAFVFMLTGGFSVIANAAVSEADLTPADGWAGTVEHQITQKSVVGVKTTDFSTTVRYTLNPDALVGNRGGGLQYYQGYEWDQQLRRIITANVICGTEEFDLQAEGSGTRDRSYATTLDRPTVELIPSATDDTAKAQFWMSADLIPYTEVRTRCGFSETRTGQIGTYALTGLPADKLPVLEEGLNASTISDTVNWDDSLGQHHQVSIDLFKTDQSCEGVALRAVDETKLIKYDVTEDAPNHTFEVLANDEGSDLELVSVEQPENGAVQQLGNVVVVSAKHHDQAGPISVPYVIRDGCGNTDDAVATLIHWECAEEHIAIALHGQNSDQDKAGYKQTDRICTNGENLLLDPTYDRKVETDIDAELLRFAANTVLGLYGISWDLEWVDVQSEVNVDSGVATGGAQLRSCFGFGGLSKAALQMGSKRLANWLAINVIAPKSGTERQDWIREEYPLVVEKIEEAIDEASTYCSDIVDIDTHISTNGSPASGPYYVGWDVPSFEVTGEYSGIVVSTSKEEKRALSPQGWTEPDGFFSRGTAPFEGQYICAPIDVVLMSLRSFGCEPDLSGGSSS